MRKLILLPFILTALVVSGCTNDKPQPETFMEIIPMEVTNISNEKTIEAMASQNKQRSFEVKHHVKARDVYVECIVSNFKFTKGKKVNSEGEGHIDLYLNDKKVDEIYTAAFIAKELPTGKHTIRVELVNNDSTTYNLSKEFEVTIAK